LVNVKLRLVFSFALAVSVFSSPIFAHHGAAAYDTDKRVTVKGAVTDWLWSNPHCILQLDAPDESGQVVHWVTETENPSSMIRSGWTRDSIKIGDQISVIVVPPKAGGHVGRIVEVTLPDGHKLLGRGSPVTPAKPDEPAKP
jgi:Family of unknown function (DUF6152)